MNPTPTQKSREAFERHVLDNFGVRLDLARYPENLHDGKYRNYVTQDRWEFWQSAHQSGREEGIAECKAKVVEEKDYVYKNPCRGSSIAGACLKNVLKAIERIQGSKWHGDKDTDFR